MSVEPAPVGIIGGTGLYELLDDAEQVTVDTPYGAPSAPLARGRLGGAEVVFVPRHGTRHEFAPHRLNYRANLWALRSAGVRRVLAPCAVGGLDPTLRPGELVVPDQVVDRTSGRAHTYVDTDGPVAHVAFADPYCPALRDAVLAQGNDATVHDGGTLVVIDGPRFSTRAESRWYAAAGGRIIGMTGMPEAGLARELALCYSAIALVTDLDAGVEQGAGVTHAEVLEAFAAGLDSLRALLAGTVATLAAGGATDDPGCPCRHAMDGLSLPVPLP